MIHASIPLSGTSNMFPIFYLYKQSCNELHAVSFSFQRIISTRMNDLEWGHLFKR